MCRSRFKTVFVLLVLILLAASALFGVLTYWLERALPPASVPRQGGKVPWHGAYRAETESGSVANSRFPDTFSEQEGACVPLILEGRCCLEEHKRSE